MMRRRCGAPGVLVLMLALPPSRRCWPPRSSRDARSCPTAGSSRLVRRAPTASPTRSARSSRAACRRRRLLVELRRRRRSGAITRWRASPWRDGQVRQPDATRSWSRKSSDGHVTSSKDTTKEDDVQAWVTEFDRVSLFTGDEALEPNARVLRARAARAHAAAQFLALALGPRRRRRATPTSRSSGSEHAMRPVSPLDAGAPPTGAARGARRAPTPVRRPFDNPRLIGIGVLRPGRAPGGLHPGCSDAPAAAETPAVPQRVVALRALRRRPHDLAGAGVRARAQHPQAWVERRRAAAVRAVSSEAGRRAAGMTIIPAVLVLSVGSEMITQQRRALVQPAGRSRC